MNAFDTAKWVWADNDTPDTHVDFLIEYDFDGQDTRLLASCDGYMSLTVNERPVPVTQYPDFPFYKSYEDIDLAQYSVLGKNTAILSVWHIGADHLTCYKSKPGAIFELWQDEKVTVASGKDTLLRNTPGYINGQSKVITGQLGPSFEFDATLAPAPYVNATVTEKQVSFVKRPVKPLEVWQAQKGELIQKTDENTYLYDFGKEVVGYVSFKLSSPKKQRIMFTWAEHTVDGHARRMVGSRDFSFFYTAKEGENLFENRMLRFGLRYLEIYCESPVCVESVEILPVNYPVNALPFKARSSLLQRIYDTCVHTVRCCMHDHYEDCPWREQGLYAMDSRNQMLAGYYAFGEYDYAEKNLLLLAKGMDENGLLPLCAPSSEVHPIPSFSLAYLWSVDEFETCSGRLVDPFVFEAACKIMNAFGKRLDESENGLIAEFEPPYWNFFEWLWGTGSYNINPEENSSLLNLMYLAAFEKYKSVCARHGALPKYPLCGHEKLKVTIRSTFMMSDGTYRVKCPKDAVSDTEYIPCDTDKTSALANSFAILSGICKDGEAERLAERIKQADVPAATLSMKGFFYDAIYMADEQNAEYIISDICKDYSHMLDRGATTFWETIIGAEDFNYAGSLCHGWNALPIYYIHKFNK